MNSEQTFQHFQDTNALLDGHFLLSSGFHSPKYLQSALALQYPADAARFGSEIAARFTDSGIETVASPAIGGLIIGYAVAAALNVRFIWTERQEGEMTVRRGFKIKPGEKILVVEDVITTGGSTRECIAALEATGGRVVGATSIIDRSNGKADVGVPLVSLVSLDVPSYLAEECPMCAAGSEAYKPGSRK
ncbi:MAG: orotate phosphoribosyltransferase [Blastocatellia bacterium]